MQTDTASVLHEAMGYIRFLHDQVQVLCSPYLQHHQPVRTTAHATKIWKHFSFIFASAASIFMQLIINFTWSEVKCGQFIMGPTYHFPVSFSLHSLIVMVT